MAPAFDAAASSAAGATVTSLSWTHTPVGTPTLVVVGTYRSQGAVPTGVTYGGQAMTMLTGGGATNTASIWYLLSPPAGPQTVSASWTTAGGRHIYGSVTFTGTVSTPDNGVTVEADNSVTVLNTTTPDMVFEVIGNERVAAGEGFTAASGQSELWDRPFNSTSAGCGAGYIKQADATSTVLAITMGFTGAPRHTACRIPSGEQIFSYSGSISPSGSFSKSLLKSFAGSISPVGAYAKTLFKSFAGAITPTSTFAFLKSVFFSWAGSITPTGTFTKTLFKAFSGAITPMGAFSFLRLFSWVGSITPLGTFTKSIFKSFAGSITPTGSFNSRAIQILYMILFGVPNPARNVLGRPNPAAPVLGVPDSTTDLLGESDPASKLIGKPDPTGNLRKK